MVRWQHTSYFEESDPERVAGALELLLGNKGGRQPGRRFAPARQHDIAIRSSGFAILVAAGAVGWTIVKTLPPELLGARARSANRPRLVELAVSLGVAAVQVNLYDSAFLVLIEVDREGRYLLSGYTPGSTDNPDQLRFHDEALAEDRIDVRFELLPLQQLVWDSIHYESAGPTLDNEQLIARLADALGGSNSAYCKDDWAAEALQGHRALPQDGSAFVLYSEG